MGGGKALPGVSGLKGGRQPSPGAFIGKAPGVLEQQTGIVHEAFQGRVHVHAGPGKKRALFVIHGNKLPHRM